MTTSVLNEWKRICDQVGVDHGGMAEVIEKTAPVLQKALVEEPLLALRAVQVLKVATLGDAAKKSVAYRQLVERLPETTLRREPLALRALILAAWPEGAGQLAGLLESAWELHEEGGEWEEEIGKWRGRVLGVKMGVGPEIEGWKEQFDQLPSTASTEVMINLRTCATLLEPYGAARRHLEAGKGTGWNLSGYGSQLLVVLQALRTDLRTLASSKNLPDAAIKLDELEESLVWINNNKGSGHHFQGVFSGHLIRVLLAFAEASEVVLHVSIEGSNLSYLTSNSSSGWAFNNFSNQLLTLIDSLKDALFTEFLEFRFDGISRTVDSQETRLQSYTSDISTSLKNYTTRLSDQIENARPQELELLWWGQAGYCHQCRKPYRKLQNVPDLLWLAASEAADRAVKLSAEPAAAFLVNAVARMGQDLSEEKTVLEWMHADYTMLRPQRKTAPPSLAPSEKLKDLLKDPACLPVSWLRQQVQQGDEPTPEDLRNKVAIDPNQKLDRGDWLTWIFRELLLERRLG